MSSRASTDAAKPLARAEVRALVEHWRAILVPEWEVTVEFGAMEGHAITRDDLDGVNAMVWRTFDSNETWVFIGAYWRDQTPAEQEETVVHELLHLVLRDMHYAAFMLTPPLGEPGDDMHSRALRHAEEVAVDRLARVIARNHPSGLPLRCRSSDRQARRRRGR